MAQPIPDGMHSITPHLVCKDAAAAMDFYVRAFGGSKEFSLPGPDGRIIHGCVRIGDSRIFLVDEFPEMGARGPISLGGTAVTLHHQVIDVDASMARAVAAGATLVKAAEDMFWGDRYGVVVDPFGHQWSLATHKIDLTPQQIVQAMHQAMPGG